jgi:hypothetical protein
LEKKTLADNVVSFWVEAPQIAKKRQAGQFIILRPNDESERVPLTIAGVKEDVGAIRLIAQIVGETTRELAALNEGDFIRDLAGPLGHPTPIKRAYCSAEDHRIVFMLAGGALKEEFRGKEVSKIVSQIDVPKTILNQLGYPTNDFIYSRNVLDSAYIPFAYFSDKTCQGTVSEDGFAKYSLTEDKILLNKMGDKVDSTVAISKALLQKSYTQFQNY